MWPLKLTHPISNSHSSIMRPLNRICKKWTATIKTKHYIIQKCVGGRTFWSSRKFFKDSTVLKLISRDTARKSKIFVGIWARCSSSDDDKSLFSCQMTLPVSASRKIIQFLQNTIDSRYINGTTIIMKKTEAKQSNLHLETIADFFCKIFVSVTTHCLHTKISIKKERYEVSDCLNRMCFLNWIFNLLYQTAHICMWLWEAVFMLVYVAQLKMVVLNDVESSRLFFFFFVFTLLGIHKKAASIRMNLNN